MITTYPHPLVVTIGTGRRAGRSYRVLHTYGKQSVALIGGGTVYRRSLTLRSQRELAADEAGVTWEWLRETLSPAEAYAWLGLAS